MIVRSEALEAAYRMAVGSDAPPKRAARLAREVEDLIMAGRLAPGSPLGSEAALAERLGVGRPALREAVRILQRRGSVRVRRGPGGGLLASAATAREVADEAHLYLLTLDAGSAEIREACDLARDLAARAARRRGAGARLGPGWDRDLLLDLGGTYLAPFILALDRLVDGQAEQPAAARAHSRAEQIARQLILEMGDRARSDVRLGCEAGLRERFGASPQIVRQAVRLLEDRGAVASERGRGKGLIMRRPTGAATVHASHSYFAAAEGTAEELRALLSDLKCAGARLAARKAGPEDQAQLRALAGTLRRVGGDDPLAWLQAPRLIGLVGANRLFSEFARCLLAYQFRAFPGLTAFGRGFSAELAREFAAVLDTVAQGDADAAYEAQAECDRRIAAWAAPSRPAAA